MSPFFFFLLNAWFTYWSEGPSLILNKQSVYLVNTLVMFLLVFKWGSIVIKNTQKGLRGMSFPYNPYFLSCLLLWSLEDHSTVPGHDVGTECACSCVSVCVSTHVCAHVCQYICAPGLSAPPYFEWSETSSELSFVIVWFTEQELLISDICSPLRRNHFWSRASFSRIPKLWKSEVLDIWCGIWRNSL